MTAIGIFWPLIAGIVGICAAGITGMVVIEWLRPDGHNAQLDVEIVGLVTLIAGQLFGLLKSAQNGKQIETKSDEVKQAVVNQGNVMANKAADIAYTASEMARQKGKYV